MNYKDLFVEKYRPTKLDEVVLTDANRAYFTKLITEKNIPNLLLYGKPGGGKTTLARIIAKELGWETLELNASDENGVDTIREKVTTFCNTASLDGEKKLVIFEEADGLSSSGGNGSSAQQILKNLIEESSDTVRFIMTVNDISKMDAPIKSRMEVVFIAPPDYKAIARRLVQICRAEGISFDYEKGQSFEDTVFYKIAKDNFPDIRRMVNAIQRCSMNESKHLEYAPEQKDIQADAVAKEVGGRLVDKFYLNRVPKESINSELVDLRSRVLALEDSFGADYHSVMRCMMISLINCKDCQLPQDAIRECILEIQDRMKWYTMVLDKELHFYAMMISLAKILYEAEKSR